MEGNTTFGVWDYVVLGLMLCISASIGIYFRFSGGKQKTTQEYLLGDKNMSCIPVSFSLMAGFMSAVTLLGVSTENYNYGTMFITINAGYFLATPITAYVYLPVFFRLQNTSVYKYLEQRFGQTTRLVSSLAYSAHLILYMGIVLYAPALALEAVTGLNKVGAILIVGIVCTFYSTIGGMKAVLFADMFQGCLMFVAIYLVIVKGTFDAQGLSEVWRVAYEGGRIELDNIDPDPTVRHTWWSLMIGAVFMQLTLYAVNQVQIQRLLTVKTLKQSQTACWLCWPLLSLVSLSTSFSGLVLYYYYYDCDPVTQGRISSTDQLMPLYVMDSVSIIPSLAGLFTAGIFSGSLSTVSSALNSLAAITLEDYLKVRRKQNKNDPKEPQEGQISNTLNQRKYSIQCGVPRTWDPPTTWDLSTVSSALNSLAAITLEDYLKPMYQYLYGKPVPETNLGVIVKLIALGFGAVCIAMAFIAEFLGGILQASYTIFGVVGGPLLGIFSLGMFTTFANEVGAVSSLLVSIATMIWIGFGGPRPGTPKLPMRVDGCNATDIGNFTRYSEFDYSRDTMADEEYLYVYRISYMWLSLIGSVMSFVVGAIVSLIYAQCSGTPREPIDPDLLTPLLRSYVIKQRSKKDSTSKLKSGDNYKIQNELSFEADALNGNEPVGLAFYNSGFENEEAKKTVQPHEDLKHNNTEAEKIPIQ